MEDIHWIDPTSEAWLTVFVDRLAGARVLLLATSRPGQAAPWLTRSHASQLALPPLSREDSLVVVRSIASADRLSDATAASIAARADGNPFFLEELSWAALTHGADAVTRVAPRSVTDVLRARIDRLAEATRQVLAAAAVLGRELPTTLLQAVAPDPGRLEAALAELKRLELLHDQAQATEPTLVFKHALTQEVAYAGLTERERQALHLAAAVAIERLHADHPTAVPRLAHHYARARHPAKAIEYLVRLAEQTQRAYAVKDCLAALGEALRFAEQLPEGLERDRCIVGLVARHALPMAFLGAYPDAVTLFQSHEAVAERLGDDPVAGAFHVWLGHTYDQLGQHALARPAAERALGIASRCDDRATVGTAHYVLSLEDFWAGQYRSGIEHGQEAVPLLDSTPERWMVGQSAWTWSINAVLLADVASAREACARVEGVAGEIEDPRLQSYAAWVRGWVALIEGDAATALEACQRALDLAPDPLSRAVALQWIGLACQDSGRPAEAAPPLQEAIEQYRLFRFVELEAWSLALLAEAAVGRGRADEAQDLALRAQVLASQSGFRYATGLSERALGRAARSRGALPEACRHLDEAIAVFRAIEARWELGRTLLDGAAVAQASGLGAVAAGHLDEARRLFREVGVPRWVARADARARELSGS